VGSWDGSGEVEGRPVSDGLLVGCPLGCGGTVGAAGADVSCRVRVGYIVGITAGGIGGNGGIDSSWLLIA